MGTTDAEGKYVITAMQRGGQGKRTVTGEYVVTVSKPEITPAKSGMGYDTKQLLPLVYTDPLPSPFPVTVIKEENYFDIPLKSDPGIDFKTPRGYPGK